MAEEPAGQPTEPARSAAPPEAEELSDEQLDEVAGGAAPAPTKVTIPILA